jgi:hypothetical protein
MKPPRRIYTAAGDEVPRWWIAPLMTWSDLWYWQEAALNRGARIGHNRCFEEWRG